MSTKPNRAVRPTVRWISLRAAVDQGLAPFPTTEGLSKALYRHNLEYPAGHPRYIRRRHGHVERNDLLAEYGLDAAQHALRETVAARVVATA